MSVPEWVDEYRHLAAEAGSTQGKMKTHKVEVGRGPLLAVTEPGVHVITVMVATQLLKTSTLLSIFGYFAHLDPCPMLLLQPKDEAVESFSKEQVTPMIRVTPILKSLIGTAKTRNGDETLRYKAFPGGFLAMASAGSPDNLARRPIRVLLSDEIDKYPVTREGNPIMLAEERTATFGLNWLSVRACSPTVDGESPIATSYEESDQRRASVACPYCGHRQFLDFFKHVDWQKKLDARGEPIGHLPKTARIHCEACSKEWSEGNRLNALATVRWHQTRPFECCGRRQSPLDVYEAAWRAGADAPVQTAWAWWNDEQEGRYAVYRAVCGECGVFSVDNAHAGFQASKLYSPWQKDKPSDIATKWLAAKGDPDRELPWWNTQMGLPHRPHTGKALDVDTLLARREMWAAEVDDRAELLTVGVDIQDYRVELEVVGWGADEESWSVDYHVIEGEFSEPATQAALDGYLKRLWHRADGTTLAVTAACIDSGGHHTQHVYDFSKARLGRRIWAVKGDAERSGIRNPVWPTKRPARKTKATFRPVMLGGNTARDTVRQRLTIEPASRPEVPVPGYMHFPHDREVAYFQQLTADRITIKEVGGRRYRVWETPSGRANEASDCRVYAYAALCGLVHFGLRLNKRAERRAVQVPPEAPVDTPAPLPPPTVRKSVISRLA